MSAGAEGDKGTRYGYKWSDWVKAAEEMRRILIDHARSGQPIYYSDLARRIQAIQLDPHSFAMAALLGEISTEEYEAGRGMLSALAVSKSDGFPAAGFFNLAEDLGLDTSDREKLSGSQPSAHATHVELDSAPAEGAL